MSPLPAAELAQARAAFQQEMTSRATILRKTSVSDRAGGFTDTYTAVYTDVPCSFSRYPVQPLERETDVRTQTVSTWSFRFPAGSDIAGTDRVVVGTRTFEVVEAGAGTVEITLLAICQEIT